MNKNPITAWSDEEILEEVRAIRIAYGLKHTMRYSSERDTSVHSESVAEHLFALHYLALYFQILEDPEKKLDMNKVHSIITFHDLGEITHGDVPYHLKTKDHELQEKEDAHKLFLALPGNLQKLAKDSWEDYEEQRSKEAEFVNALDKIEPLFELFDPINERTLKRLKNSYDKHFNQKFTATENFPIMRRFVEAVSRDMLKRKVFWEE